MGQKYELILSIWCLDDVIDELIFDKNNNQLLRICYAKINICHHFSVFCNLDQQGYAKILNQLQNQVLHTRNIILESKIIHLVWGEVMPYSIFYIYAAAILATILDSEIAKRMAGSHPPEI